MTFGLFDVSAPFDAVGPFDDGVLSDAIAVADCCTPSDVGGLFDVSAVLAASAMFDSCERSGNDVPIGAGVSFEERASVDDRTSDPEAKACEDSRTEVGVDLEVPSNEAISSDGEDDDVWDAGAEACMESAFEAGVPLDARIPSDVGVSFDEGTS